VRERGTGEFKQKNTNGKGSRWHVLRRKWFRKVKEIKGN
jgi:hypothetical protein